MNQADKNPNPFRQQIHVDQVRMAYRSAPLSLLAAMVNAMILGTLNWSVIGHTVILTWIAAISITSSLRLLVIRQFHRRHPENEAIIPWGHLAVAGAWLSGLSWGAAAYFLFAPNSLPHQVFLAFVIAGTTAGAVTTLSAQRWAVIGFILLSVMPLFYRLMQANHEFSTAMSMLVLIFVSLMTYVANRFHLNLTDMLKERHEREMSQQHDRDRNEILEMVAKGASVSQVLNTIVTGIEREHPGMLCSILLLDESGKHLLSGAAPSLPDFYNEAINGVAIGPGVGSCGTAAHTGKRVIVSDIQNHEYWAPYRELAAKAKLGACWSEPIISTSGLVLGTLAVYHRNAHEPSDDEIAAIEQLANLTGIVLERSQTF